MAQGDAPQADRLDGERLGRAAENGARLATCGAAARHCRSGESPSARRMVAPLSVRRLCQLTAGRVSA